MILNDLESYFIIYGTNNVFFKQKMPFSRRSLTDPIYRPVAGGETSPWEKPSCDISPSDDIIGVRAEIRTQNSVLSNTRLAKMVPLSHLRRLYIIVSSGEKNVITPKFSNLTPKMPIIYLEWNIVSNIESRIANSDN
jgi:hypothetical protein